MLWSTCAFWLLRTAGMASAWCASRKMASVLESIQASGTQPGTWLHETCCDHAVTMLCPAVQLMHEDKSRTKACKTGPLSEYRWNRFMGVRGTGLAPVWCGALALSLWWPLWE